MHRRLLASPAARAGRLRREATGVLVGLVCAPIGFVLATWVLGLGDPRAPSFADILSYLLRDRPWLLVEVALFVPACIVATMVAQRLLVPSRLRRVLRRVLLTRPDVDRADPRLAFRTHVVVDDDGVESRSAAGSTTLRWSVLKRWEEARGRLIILGYAMDGFCLNTATTDPAAVERLRVCLAVRLGPARAVGRG